MTTNLLPFAAVEGADWQTVGALVVVAIAAVWLSWRGLRSKKSTGCGGGACPAVSPEIKKLKAQVVGKRR